MTTDLHDGQRINSRPTKIRDSRIAEIMKRKFVIPATSQAA
jgi:hypothetical protein